MIKWLFKWFRGKPVPKYLSGKKESVMILNAPWDELYGYPKPPNLMWLFFDLVVLALVLIGLAWFFPLAELIGL